MKWYRTENDPENSIMDTDGHSKMSQNKKSQKMAVF